MVLATVPEAPPTTRNQRATSSPAPISANEPKVDGSRFRVSALPWVSSSSVEGIARLQFDDHARGQSDRPRVVAVRRQSAAFARLCCDRMRPCVFLHEHHERNARPSRIELQRGHQAKGLHVVERQRDDTVLGRLCLMCEYARTGGSTTTTS